MKDALLSTIIKPLQGIFDTVRLILAVLICLIPILIKFFTSKRTFTRSDELFNFLKKLPGGTFIFNRLILWATTTYTETCRPTVVKVSQKDAEIYIDDRCWMRNPFGSIHAVALSNLAELTTGMAVICATQHQKGVRAIPNRIDMEYLKKARGRITATTTIDLPRKNGPYNAVAELRDSKGELVSRGTVTWVVSVKE